MNGAWSDPAVIAAMILATGGLVTTAVFRGGDLLRELRQRKIYRLRAKLKKICPHYALSDDGGGLGPVAELYPEKGHSSRCRVCNSRLYPPEQQYLLQYWSDASRERQAELMKSRNEAAKLRGKLERLGRWKDD